ncbi:hypothetical protein [Paraburkholderia sp. BCC1885]|nr:hypothetical protein [Paraburkholderia sp. BCC1885]
MACVRANMQRAAHGKLDSGGYGRTRFHPRLSEAMIAALALRVTLAE